jgi:hypothetical protein
MVENRKDKFFVMAVNFFKDRHADLIEWIKKEAAKEDRSLSSFCINALKEYRRQKEETNAKKENVR